MGEEFCKGCEDCTNFNNNEGNLSYFANKPITKLDNTSFINGNYDNSMLNKTDFQNDTSLLTNNNINNINDYKKNDLTRLSTINSKRNNNEDTNILNNAQFYQKDSDYIFKQNNDDNINNYNYFNNNYNNEINEVMNSQDKERLNEIKKNYYSKKITKLFKKFMKIKAVSHQTLCKEHATTDDIYYYQNNIINELDVNLSPDKNYLYIGTKYNYAKDGYGLEIYSNSKAKYFGRFKNDKRVSIGRFTINNNNFSYYYYGEIKDLYACGFGWHENYKESIYYEGMWKNSKKEGYGIERYNKDNSIYQGCFSNGKKDGIGYFVWNDNSSYMGEWSRGALEGYGIYRFQDGSIYTGTWKNNKMNGLGEFTFPELKTYFGFFEKDKRSGFGVLIWYKENKVFIGFWADNKQNGLGKFINNDKKRYGLWENGSIKEKIKDEENFISRLNYEEKKYQYLFRLSSYKDVLMKINHILSI